MIRVIALQEFRRMMRAPLAWVILALIQFVAALQFLESTESFMMAQAQLVQLEDPPGVSDWVVAPMFAEVAFVLLMVVPVVTMRSLSAERRDRTISLLLSAPVSMTEIVLGKYAGILLYLSLMVGMILLMPLALIPGTALDIGKVIAGVLGLFMMLAAFSAAGLFISSMTRSPAVAAVVSFFLLFALWLMFWINSGGDKLKDIVEYLSLLHHFIPLLQGSIDTRDVAYFVLFSVFFLVLTVRRLDTQRLQG